MSREVGAGSRAGAARLSEEGIKESRPKPGGILRKDASADGREEARPPRGHARRASVNGDLLVSDADIRPHEITEWNAAPPPFLRGSVLGLYKLKQQAVRAVAMAIEGPGGLRAKHGFQDGHTGAARCAVEGLVADLCGAGGPLPTFDEAGEGAFGPALDVGRLQRGDSGCTLPCQWSPAHLLLPVRTADRDASAVGDLHERIFENYNIWAVKMGARPGQQQDAAADAAAPTGSSPPRCVYSLRHDPDGPAIIKARKAARRQAATEQTAALSRTYGVIGGASHVRSSSSSSSSYSAQSAPALQQPPGPQPPMQSATAAASSSAAGTGIVSSASPTPGGGADASGGATAAGSSRPPSASPASQSVAAGPDAPPAADALHTATPTKRLGADAVAVSVPVHVPVSALPGSDTTTRLTDLALWYCIRAEAANLRFMPE